MRNEKRYPCPHCDEVAVVACEVITRDPGLPNDDSEPYWYTDCRACKYLGPAADSAPEAVAAMMERAELKARARAAVARSEASP